MEIEEIKTKLARKATGFVTGGFKPTNSVSESWVGRVYLYKENETIPTDDDGNLMFPLFQLCLDGLPFIPEALADTKVITVFVSGNIPMDLALNGKNWVLREYKNLDNLVVKDLANPQTPFRAFPLSNIFIEQDFPAGDSDDIPGEIAQEISRMEKEGIINYFDDFNYYYQNIYSQENYYGHKIGGYPDFCQSAISFGDDFEFVFQISSDEKAQINIVDGGNIYLSKNPKTGDWKFYCDFY